METEFNWIDFIVFIFLLLFFVYILFTNEAKHLQKVYVSFHIVMLLWPYGLFSISTTENPAFQWAYLNTAFIGIILFCFGWLLFSVQMTRMQTSFRFRRLLVSLISVPPLLLSILITLNPLHHLFATPIADSFVYRDYGPLFYVMIIFCLAYIVAGYAFMAPSLFVRKRVMNRRVVWFMLGQFLLVSFAVADVVLNNAFDYDAIEGLTSIGIAASYCCFAYAIQRYNMYRVVSLAHASVIESMDSGFVVLNEQNQIVDFNQNAKRFIPVKNGEAYPIDHCLDCMDPQDSEDFLHVYSTKPRATIQAELIRLAPTKPYVLMRIHPIIDRNDILLGRVISFQDISEWRHLVEELHMKNQDLSIRNKELTATQEELYSANQKLELIATTDSLTGCYNRRYLFQMMEYQINVDKRYQEPFAIILLDIDFFKSINDTYSHQAGDEVLKQTAALISDRIRESDILARYGGEEFAIFLPHTSYENALLAAEQVRKIVESNTVSTNRGEIGITISIGVASSELEVPVNMSTKEYISRMLAIADEALYRAKDQGRNRIEAGG